MKTRKKSAKQAAKKAVKKIRIPLGARKTMVLEVIKNKIVKASVGNVLLAPSGPFFLKDRDLVLNGKKITYLSPEAAIVTHGSQTCVLKKIGNKYVWICNPPSPPC